MKPPPTHTADVLKKLSDAFLDGVQRGLSKTGDAATTAPTVVSLTRLADGHFLIMPGNGTLADARAVSLSDLEATLLAMLGVSADDLIAQERNKLH
jgi:hypothetical protein